MKPCFHLCFVDLACLVAIRITNKETTKIVTYHIRKMNNSAGMDNDEQHRKQPRQRKRKGGGARSIRSHGGGLGPVGITSNCNNDERKATWEDVNLSKALSWVLRHSASSLGLHLASDGYIALNDVLSLNHPRFKCVHNNAPKYTVEDVERVVRENDKQRFRLEYKDNVLCIRANQGHSIKDVQSNQLLSALTKQELSNPQLSIIHGTTRKAWETYIIHEGLKRMTRNHIHFATSLPSSSSTSEAVGGMEEKVAIPTNDSHHCHHQTKAMPIIKSGIRTKSEVYIYINGIKCATDDVPFYQSDNGVILTAGINEGGVLPLKYFAKVVDAQSGKILWNEQL